MHLKVISLNLWIGGILLDKIVDFLKAENPDFLFLQEVYNGRNEELKPQLRSLSMILDELGYPFYKFAPAFLEDEDGQLVPQGNAILSKFPLEDAGVIFYDEPFGIRDNRIEAFHKTPRNLQHVTAYAEGVKLHLLNTQGIWGLDGNDSPRRLKMSETIFNEIAGLEKVILAGDLNVRPDTQAIGNIENQLQNVFKGELKTSFNLKRKDLESYPGYAEAVVDMIFVSPDIKIISKECPQVDISDHLPLIAELAI